MSEWISVKDRLPEIIHRPKGNPCSDNILVTDGKNIQAGCRWICGQREEFLSDYREDMGEITHWMPLPKPPENR